MLQFHLETTLNLKRDTFSVLLSFVFDIQSLGLVLTSILSSFNNFLVSVGAVSISSFQSARLIGRCSPVVTACQPSEKGVLAWMV